MDTISISDLRANLPTLIDEVSDKLKSFIVTVSGKPKAVVISLEEIESLQETAEIMAIPGAAKSIAKGFTQIKKGNYIKLNEVLRRYESTSKPKSRRKS